MPRFSSIFDRDVLIWRLIWSPCHRLTDRMRQEGTSGDYPVQYPAQSSISESRLLRAVSTQVLSVSGDGDSTASLGKLCQCLPSQYKSIFCVHKESGFGFVPIGACLARGHHWEESGSLCIPSHQVFTHTDKMPLHLLYSRVSQLSQPFHVMSNVPLP